MNALSDHSVGNRFDSEKHWNNVYNKSDPEKLGWYEEYATPSLQLIDRCSLPKDARILNIGAGATTLIDDLLNTGYENLIATDISEIALNLLKDRLAEKQDQVQWVIDDLTKPRQLPNISPIDLWHDRAVLHFFLEEHEQKTYFDLLRKLVKQGGYVIIATFNLKSAEKCSGLRVQRYDAKTIAEQLGSGFKMLQSFDHICETPSGDTREYVYTLFQKEA